VTGVERPVTQEQHSVCPQKVAGRTPGPRGARITHLNESEHWVYKHQAADGSVLYVGCTVDRDARLRQHERESAWYPHIAETSYEGPFTRADGLAREAALIASLDPPNNVAYTRRDFRRRANTEAFEVYKRTQARPRPRMITTTIRRKTVRAGDAKPRASRPIQHDPRAAERAAFAAALQSARESVSA
jgi:hypothetical protein